MIQTARYERVSSIRCVLSLILSLLLLSALLWVNTNAPRTIDASNTNAAKIKSKKDPVPTSIHTLPVQVAQGSVQAHLGGKPILDSYIPGSLPIKTLVVLIGNLRCGEIAWRSLYQNLLDWNNDNQSSSLPHVLDLALTIGSPDESTYSNASLIPRAKYIFTFPEYGDDWSEALNLIDPSWKAKIAPLVANSSIVLGGVRYGNWHGSGAISFWIRWFLSQKLVEHNLVSRYDRFVITRTDHFYMCPHDLSQLDPRFLWVPFGQDYGGITDRHLIVSSQHVLAALNVLPALFQDPSPYPSLSDDSYNPEQLLLDRWKQEGLTGLVRRFPRMMFTCGNPSGDDSTRWKATGDIVEEGVRKKYRKEYLQSEETCKG